MSFVTIIARHAGTCKRCRRPITPGQSIRWCKRAGSYHLARDCGGARNDDADHEARFAGHLDRPSLEDRADEYERMARFDRMHE